MTPIDPHAGEAIETAGAPLSVADAAVILLHGRGDSPAGILRLVDEVYHRGVHYVAPAAAGRVWYPGGFTDPITDRRAAYLASAFGQVDAALDVTRSAGVPPDRVVLAGFSQGAAVALEYATRRPRRYGGLVALAGGLLGPPARFDEHEQFRGFGQSSGSERFDPPEPSALSEHLDPPVGSLERTPAFCGVGIEDPTISVDHVDATARVLSAMDAETTVETYPGLGHAIGDGEMAALNRLIGAVSPD